MNKHLLMLSAAAVALSASPAFATCPSSLTCDDVTTVLSAPIKTSTAGAGSTPEAIQIESGGGVKISKTGAAVTVDSSNWLTNFGNISNTGTSNAQGIKIDAGGGTLDLTLTTQKGVTNGGTIDLTGSGDGKIGLELDNGKMIGPITLQSNSVIKVAGDNSAGLEISQTGVLQGDLTLDGAITLTPTNANAFSTTLPSAIVNVAGLVNGNVTINSTAVLTNSGAQARGIVIGGQICDALGCASASRTAGDFGSFVNFGNVTVLGKAGQGNTPATTFQPESGSALIVTGNVEGGIVNAGGGFGSATTAAVLAGSGITTLTGIAPVVSIISPGTALTIGEYTSDPVGSPNFSFLNYGTIFAEPSSANHSTTAINIQGNSSTVFTTLTGGFLNQGNITAVATSTSGTNAANPSATALLINNYAVVPTLDISGASGAGSVNAVVTGAEGGAANAIVFQSNANNQDPVAHPTVIDILSGASVSASASTTNPSTVEILKAVGILDNSGTVKQINNAGTISATVTTLTSNSSAAGFNNDARAIDLSANLTGGITLNNSGTITGDVFLNGAGTQGTVVSVGAGSATGASAAQMAAAASAATAATPFGASPGGTGRTNTGTSASTGAFLNGNLVFGSGTGTGASTLYINDFGTVTGAILTKGGGDVDIGVSQHGVLNVTNTGATGTALVRNVNIYGNGAVLDISVSDSLRQAGLATITGKSGGVINIDAGSVLGINIASFVPQPGALPFDQYVLIHGPVINIPDLATYQTQIENHLPFYFQRDAACQLATSTANCSLQFTVVGLNDNLVLNLRPKTAAQLGLIGDAATVFPAVNAVLTPSAAAGAPTDDQLGAAIVNGITDSASAENVFSQFAPDVSGNERAIAVQLTDQASGPVAARQRMLRMYANQGGDLTLWGQEYAQYINDKGKTRGGGLTNFKDHGFGFSVGADSGDPADGWYGGAFTFFAGDATETEPRNAKAQTEWYMLTGYTAWRGHHLFLDTQASAALANIRAKRTLTITSGGQTILTREADSKRPGLLGAVGATTGAIFNWGNLFLIPQVSLDGMTLREEGFTEKNGGAGFNLQVQPYYATSLRTFVGADSRVDWDLGDFLLQPEARIGYRFEFLDDPVKVRAAFASNPAATAFTITGPDPARGNVVAGATLGASTDTWSMGVNFDWVRGSNGSSTEVGTFSLLGRI